MTRLWFPSPASDAELTSDLQGSKRVISSDHHRADTGYFAQRNRLPDLRTRWVDHADETDEHQVFFQLCWISWRGELLHRSHGKPQHAHALPGKAIMGFDNSLAPGIVQRLESICRVDARGDLQQTVH